MLSPQEQKTTLGDRTRCRSTTSPVDNLTPPVVSLLPTNSSSAMNSISSRLSSAWPPHHFSNDRKRLGSVSILDHTLWSLVQKVLAGFRFSKLWTRKAPSKMPSPTSLASDTSQLPPSIPPM